MSANKQIKCDICGKAGFKTTQGLAGHKKIVHGVTVQRIGKDEVDKRLAKIENILDDLSAYIADLQSQWFFVLGELYEPEIAEELVKVITVFDKNKSRDERLKEVFQTVRRLKKKHQK